MTNTKAYLPKVHDCNGSTTCFSFDWKISATNELVILLQDSTGEQTTLRLNIDYSATFSSDTGGSITTTTAYENGNKIIISRSTPQTQTSDYKTSGGFDSKAVEESFDKSSTMVQDVAYDLKRAIKVPIGSDVLNLNLPAPVGGKTLKWKSDLSGLENSNVNIDDIDTAVQEAQQYSEAASSSATAASNSASSAAASLATVQSDIGVFNETYQSALQDVEDGIEEIEIQTLESLNELRSAGYGLPPSVCTALDVVKNENSISLTWKDPKDTIVDSQILCTWAGTKIVRQVGRCPLSPDDGILIKDSRIRNAHETTALIDNAIESGVEYFYTAFPYSTNGAFSYDKKNQFGTIIYGYELNLLDSNPRTVFKRLGDCANFNNAQMDFTNNLFNLHEWEDAWFVKKNRPVMLKYDGTVDYELDHMDHTRKLGGVQASDIGNTSYAGNAMSEIPQVWTKVEFDGFKIRKYFANRQIDNTYKANSFYNKNNELMPVTYMPMYNGSYISNKIRSLSGQGAGNSQSGTTEITWARNNGEGWDTEVLADRILINDLLLLMGGSLDTQSVYGNGHYTGGSQAAHLLQTGTMNTKGQFWGTNGTGSGVKVFFMENWWGNIWRRIAGWVNVNGTQKIKLTRGTQDGSTATDYNTTGDGYIVINATPSGTTGGYQSGFALNEYGFFPQVASGTSTTFTTDGFWFNNAQIDYALVGGACRNGALVGAFSSSLDSLVPDANWYIGSAVSCKPL